MAYFWWIQSLYTLEQLNAPWIRMYLLLVKIPYSKLPDCAGITLDEVWFFGWNVVWRAISSWQDQQVMAKVVLGAKPVSGRSKEIPPLLPLHHEGAVGCRSSCTCWLWLWWLQGESCYWWQLFVSFCLKFLSGNHFSITFLDSAGINSNCLKLGRRLLRIIISRI